MARSFVMSPRSEGLRHGLGVLALASLLACSGGIEPDADEQAATAMTLKDGTAEAVGLLAFLADEATTFEVLDGAAGLDKRAAENLIAHRDGPDANFGTADDDPFDSVAEVDAVPRVGPVTLDKLVAYASSQGFVPTGDELLGVYDGVSFTVAEAAATLAFVNAASHDALDDDLSLDVRAADNIVAAQPIATVLALSELAYVGTKTMEKLKAASATSDGGQAVAAALAGAVQGLHHMSESDYPLVSVIVLDQGQTPITATDIKARIASIYVEREGDVSLADRDVEVRPLESFFDRYIQPEDYWEPEQHEAAPKFEAVYEILRDQLTDARVYRLGYRYTSDSYTSPFLSGAIDVYVVGRSADGHLVGIWTISVET